MRRLLFATAVVVLFVPVVAADAPGRYELAPSATGFVRLDTATGATSHCSEVGGVWQCQPLGETDGALAVRLDALSAEVTRLAAALAELTARLDMLAARFDRVTPPVAAEAPPPEARRGIIATAMERLFDLVRMLKHGAARAA